MSGAVERVVVTRGIERVVTVRQAGWVVEVRQLLSPRVTVVSAGVQGPVGALAENVLQRVLLAEKSAADAVQSLDGLMRGLKGRFDYYAGAISAQKGGA
ncbi:TPA: hypothetical protein NIB79_005229 [Pseudomonas aeruginosa]|nr:hypothetical protein [Pseudomonas aeruginosa]